MEPVGASSCWLAFSLGSGGSVRSTRPLIPDKAPARFRDDAALDFWMKPHFIASSMVSR